MERKRGQGLWLTVGEVVGVLALAIAGLNYWESHREHLEAVRLQQAQTQAATAFVATGEADSGGRVINLRPLKSSQAIQSQRYRFPADVRSDPIEMTAERPRIEADWLAEGLKHALEAAHAKPSGEARIPVVIETVYFEDGDTHTDVSLYEIGFAWKHAFIGGWQVRLRGSALSRRGLTGDAAKAMEKPWADAKSRFSGDFAIPPA